MINHENDWLYEIREFDRDIYRRVLPAESPLLDALDWIPWESFIPELESYYSANEGTPSIPPLIMLKLEFLKYLYRLSDRSVIDRATTDLLFRWFLQVPVRYSLPCPTSLTKFRGRLGDQGYRKLFDRLVRCARDQNLVRDRLRLKDASHVLANIAVPSSLGLLAQLRKQMLEVVAKLDLQAAAGFQIALQQVQSDTEHQSDDLKLQGRLALVIDILGWMKSCSVPAAPTDGQNAATWHQLQAVSQLAEKIVNDFQNPGQGDRLLSVVDPDARRGKHGDFFDGFLVDVMMDADSQLITTMDVIAANGEEAKDTIGLVRMEHEAHGNQIEQVSLDGIGFHGETLRTLEAPDGLSVDVMTPPRVFNTTAGFSSDEFQLSEDGLHMICPAGKTSGRASRRKDKPNNTFYTFSGTLCATCALLNLCHPGMKAESRTGRRVSKNDYDAEYARAREKATTPRYQAVRREHPAIERKLNEIVRHHAGRRALFWGQAKVRMQELMICFTVNVKRMVRLLNGQRDALRAVAMQ